MAISIFVCPTVICSCCCCCCCLWMTIMGSKLSWDRGAGGAKKVVIGAIDYIPCVACGASIIQHGDTDFVIRLHFLHDRHPRSSTYHFTDCHLPHVLLYDTLLPASLTTLSVTVACQDPDNLLKVVVTFSESETFHDQDHIFDRGRRELNKIIFIFCFIGFLCQSNKSTKTRCTLRRRRTIFKWNRTCLYLSTACLLCC